MNHDMEEKNDTNDNDSVVTNEEDEILPSALADSVTAKYVLIPFNWDFPTVKIQVLAGTTLGVHHATFQSAYELHLCNQLLDPELLAVMPTSSPLGLYCVVVCVFVCLFFELTYSYSFNLYLYL
jgi:ABC-type Fe3+-siderophore transport system permease subunit